MKRTSLPTPVPGVLDQPVAGRIPVRLGQLERPDTKRVSVLLRDLDCDYPGGAAWLEQRLQQVLVGQASCTLAWAGRSLAGVTILTPKPKAMKLSTIFVAPRWRRFGIGSLLLDQALASLPEHATTNRLDHDLDAITPVQAQATEVYVTVAHHTWPILAPLLLSRGFTRTAFERDRYGRGRHEIVATRLRS